MCILFEGKSEKVYLLYTHLNVDNYGWPLSIVQVSLLYSDMVYKCIVSPVGER